MKKIYVSLVFVAFLYGANPVAVKIGMERLDPYVFTVSRLAIASGCFILALIKSRQRIKIKPKDRKTFLLIGGCAFIFQVMLIEGLVYVDASVATTIIGLMPVSIMAIKLLQKKEVFSRHQVLGIILALIGILLVSNSMGYFLTRETSQVWRGVLFLFLGQLAAGVYMVKSESLLKKYSHYQVTGTMFTLAFLMTLLFMVVKGDVGQLYDIELSDLGILLYSGVFSLFIANLIWIWAISFIGSVKVAIFNNLPPLFTLLLGALILTEIPSFSQLVGVFIVIIGLLVFNEVFMIKRMNYDKL